MLMGLVRSLLGWFLDRYPMGLYLQLSVGLTDDERSYLRPQTCDILVAGNSQRQQGSRKGVGFCC